MKIAIIDYEAGNKRSVLNATRKIGFDAEVTSNIDRLSQVDKIIFPGVGQAKFAMESLRSVRLDSFLKNTNIPLLGICLGMQLMGQHHSEGGVQGLGMINEDVRPFETALKIPHLGWNKIKLMDQSKPSPLFDQIRKDAYFYFIHSFYMPVGSHTTAVCSYDQTFSAAIQYKNIYATQFHPEKSGEAGLQLIKNFIEKC